MYKYNALNSPHTSRQLLYDDHLNEHATSRVCEFLQRFPFFFSNEEKTS